MRAGAQFGSFDLEHLQTVRGPCKAEQMSLAAVREMVWSVTVGMGRKVRGKAAVKMDRKAHL